MKVGRALAAAAVAALPCLCAGPAAARAAPAPSRDSRELIAREQRQTRLAPANERELWNVHVAGLDGTLVVVRHGRDSRSSMTLGPFMTERGSERSVRWHQNENGETVIDRVDPAELEEISARSAAHVHAPFDAWLLTTTYRSGGIVRTYFDPRGFAVVRVERSLPGRAAYIAYDDFRTDARGWRRPWHEFGGEGRSDITFEYHLVRDDAGGRIAREEFAVPGDRRALVEFPAARTVRLPARFQNGRIVVRLQIAGRGLDFLLDSGAAALTLDADVARELRLTQYGRSTTTVAGALLTSRAIVPRIDVGALVLRNAVVRTMPLSLPSSARTRIVGLLGFDFLDQVALQIDYANRTVTAARPGTESVPADAMPLALHLGAQTPNVRASVGVASGNDFILDTGADVSLVVFGRFMGSHPAAAATLGKQVFWSDGIGGTMAYRNLAPQRLTLGSLRLEGLPAIAAVSPSALGLDDEDGLIGSEVLQRFTVDLDYAANRAYLERFTRR